MGGEGVLPTLLLLPRGHTSFGKAATAARRKTLFSKMNEIGGRGG